MSSPWIDLQTPLEPEPHEFVCPDCNLVKPKHLATTLGRWVVCGECGD